jgi:hypothetical protein
MTRNGLLLAAFWVIMFGTMATAEPVAVKQLQLPRHGSMVARSEAGKSIAQFDFLQTVQGDEVTMHLVYHFVDGSIDDETTTYTQRGTFQLVRDHHIQQGPFFVKTVDCTVDAVNGAATTRTVDKNGQVRIQTEHMSLPNDLANGFVGTLLLNVPPNTAPLRVGMVAPILGGRLIRLLISPEGEQPFKMAGQSLRATVFRVHPELGGIVGVIAQLIGLQPKDVMVWVLEGEKPAVVRTVGQLGGYGPLVSSELEGTSFER